MQSFWKEVSQLNASGFVTPSPSVAFHMVQSNEIRRVENAGEKEYFEKLKQWLKNYKTGIDILKG